MGRTYKKMDMGFRRNSFSGRDGFKASEFRDPMDSFEREDKARREKDRQEKREQKFRDSFS